MIHFSFSRNIPIGTFANGMARNGGLAQADSVLAFLEQDGRIPPDEYSATPGQMGSSSQVSPSATTEGRAVNRRS
jgi:hypothetical protein